MKFSIITINLNNAPGLKETIESVICQDSIDYEYIVIDGGSTDDSVGILEQYTNKIDYWISEPDTGIYNAMNKGILQAKGEYCLFLNSGDTLIRHTILSELLTLDFNQDIVYGNVIKIFQKERIQNKGVGKSEFGLYDLIIRRMNHQACFIKRDLFDRFGLYSEEYKIASDWKFFIDTIIVGNVFVRYIDWDISCFDTMGVSTVYPERAYEETQKILESTFPPRVLSDIKELDRYKHASAIKLYDKLIANKTLLKIYNKIFHGLRK